MCAIHVSCERMTEPRPKLIEKLAVKNHKKAILKSHATATACKTGKRDKTNVQSEAKVIYIYNKSELPKKA